MACSDEEGKRTDEQENKDKILEKRYKGEGSKGSGLGLFLVKSILESYKGDISIEDSETAGVRFEISLKKA
ncbi:MAG: ATP-binding protein [Candidatus Thermoplasmatota archaeon]